MLSERKERRQLNSKDSCLCSFKEGVSTLCWESLQKFSKGWVSSGSAELTLRCLLSVEVEKSNSSSIYLYEMKFMEGFEAKYKNFPLNKHLKPLDCKQRREIVCGLSPMHSMCSDWGNEEEPVKETEKGQEN